MDRHEAFCPFCGFTISRLYYIARFSRVTLGLNFNFCLLPRKKMGSTQKALDIAVSIGEAVPSKFSARKQNCLQMCIYEFECGSELFLVRLFFFVNLTYSTELNLINLCVFCFYRVGPRTERRKGQNTKTSHDDNET